VGVFVGCVGDILGDFVVDLCGSERLACGHSLRSLSNSETGGVRLNLTRRKAGYFERIWRTKHLQPNRTRLGYAALPIQKQNSGGEGDTKVVAELAVGVHQVENDRVVDEVVGGIGAQGRLVEIHSAARARSGALPSPSCAAARYRVPHLYALQTSRISPGVPVSPAKKERDVTLSGTRERRDGGAPSMLGCQSARYSLSWLGPSRSGSMVISNGTTLSFVASTASACTQEVGRGQHHCFQVYGTVEVRTAGTRGSQPSLLIISVIRISSFGQMSGQ